MEFLNIISGSKYYVTIDKYMSYFCDLKASEKEKNTIITMTYGEDSNNYESDKDLTLLSKEVVESKVNTNSQTQTLRYDAMKMLLESLLETEYDSNGEIVMTPRQKLAFNTLVKSGILVKIEE
jgi:hypothetical protein